MYTIIDIRLSFLKQNSFVWPIFKCFELPLSLTFHLPQMLDLNYQPSLSISSFEIFQFSSITQCCLTLQSHGLRQARLLCSSPTPGVCSNSCPLSQWCHSTISSSGIPFFSCPQSFPASGSFPMSGLFPSGGHNIGASASASVLPVTIQGWFPLGLTGLILLSKGLSRVFFRTTV